MKIKVNKSNGRVYLPDKYLARDMDNLIQTFEVEFDDEFIEGIGQLDFILPSGTKGYINMELNDETYSVPIYNSICKEGRLDLQFLVFLNARFILTSDTKIIEGHTYYVKQGDTYVEVENPVEEDLGEYYVESVPLYHSKMFNLTVDPSINAELEQDEEYPTKIALINAKLKEVEDAIDDCEAATEGAENVNISQSKSNHTISITTTDRNDTQTTETLTEPTASVSKVDKTATITITDANGTTSASVKDGANFEYNWDGTSLGVKTDEESEYSYVDLEGPRGPQGPQGEAFQIKKTYPTIQAMVDDYYNMSVNDYVMIDGDVETQDNATLWVKEETPAVGTLWHYLADFSGASGIQGPQGEQGPRGEQGIQGIQGPIGLTGNGISTITKTSTSGLVDTYTILYTNGDTTTYDITNGANGNITDVQLDGTSIVTNHVANALTTGYSTDNKLITEKDYNRAMSIYNVLPKVNGTGENISLDNTGVAPLNMDLYGNTYQETTSISGGDEYDSPSPDHPQPIQVVSGDNEVKVVGENLLDGTLIDRGHSYTYGNVGQTPYIQVNNSRATLSPTNAIKVKPNTSYIINHNSTWRLAVAQLKEDGVSLGDSGWKTSSNMPFTITTNANCKYIAFNFSKSDDSAISESDLTNFIKSTLTFNEGSIVTPEPYTSSSYQVNLGDIELCKIGTYQDKFFKAINGNTIYDNLDSTIKNTLDYGEWYLEKNIGKVVLDGDEGWDISSGTLYCSSIGGYYDNFIPYCNYYSGVINKGNAASMGINNTIAFGTSTTLHRLYVKDNTHTSGSDFETWLSTHNTIVYYVLNTPTYTKIEGTLASQLEDISYALSKKTQTNISQINNDLPFIIDAETLRDISEWSE